MINQSLLLIKNYLKDYLSKKDLDSEIVIGPLNKDALESKESGLLITLLHIEEERSLKAQNPYFYPNKSCDKASVRMHAPDLLINLYIVISAMNENYATALKLISQVLGAFQQKSYFSEDEVLKKGYTDLKNINVELYPLSLEEANRLWEPLSSRRMPFLVYKLRSLLLIDAIDEAPEGLVKEVILKTNVGVDK